MAGTDVLDPLIGKRLAGRFEIQERIGEGGTGVVYKAEQLAVKRTVAIKVLGAHVSTDPNWVRRFQNEALAASRLTHPNTVRLIDLGQTEEGLFFIAMEFLQGRSLRAEIHRVGRMSPARVLRIIGQMCASLAEAHSQGVIHRDIKPDNIYLTDLRGSDFVKVLDFSVAKVEAAGGMATRAGVVFGTPAYMSPEQARGVGLDARSDLYAVGIVGYEMLSGKPPFDAPLPTEIVMKQLRDIPAPLTGVPPEVAALVMRALEKDAGKRFQSAEDMEAECHACLARMGVLPSAGPMGNVGAGPPPAASDFPPPPAPASPGVSSAAASGMAGIAGQKTLIAGVSAPVAGPPPPSAPPPAAPPAPAAPRARARSSAPPPAASTAPAPGTMMLPDSAGVVAFAQREAQEVRSSAAPKARPAGALFWAAWAVLGVAAGLALHFVRMLQAGA